MICRRTTILAMAAIAACAAASSTNTNTYVGNDANADGASWFGKASDWSQDSFPAWPEHVTVPRRLSLTKSGLDTNAQSAKSATMRERLTVSGGALTIGARRCWATQRLVTKAARR